jgi:protein-S-isoprenylcysteine O-methyltransferase Ste14
MWWPHNIIVACWLVFLLYWIISARGAKPSAERPSAARVLAYRLPNLLGVILFFVPDPFGPPLSEHLDAARSLGAALCVLGLIGAIHSRRTLADNWSRDVEFKQGHKLIEDGPYRFIRHPIYTSILLMLLGSALATNRVLAYLGCVCVLVGFFIKLKQEERLMLQHFPAEYPAYKARTKMLVPFLV